MKKYIIVPAILILVALLSLNFIIKAPDTLVLAYNIRANSAGLYRTINSQHWWNSHTGNRFRLDKKLLNGADVTYVSNGNFAKGNILLAPIKHDSTLIRWETAVPVSSRVSGWLGGYLKAGELNQDMKNALAELAVFTSDNANIYGRKVEQTTMKDSVMLITRFTVSDTPTTQQIYDKINSIRKHVTSLGLQEASHPMAHVSWSDSGYFKCMVAVPVNRSAVFNDDDISLIRMVPGRFISTAVTGGPHSIRRAYETIDQYLEDHKRTAVALPFEYLVTDRLATPDTSQWKTIIYAPVY